MFIISGQPLCYIWFITPQGSHNINICYIQYKNYTIVHMKRLCHKMQSKYSLGVGCTRLLVQCLFSLLPPWDGKMGISFWLRVSPVEPRLSSDTRIWLGTYDVPRGVVQDPTDATRCFAPVRPSFPATPQPLHSVLRVVSFSLYRLARWIVRRKTARFCSMAHLCCPYKRKAG